MWTAADITIVLDDSLSVGSVVTATIRTPEGDLQIIADVERFDRELVLAGLHIQSENLRPNQFRMGTAATACTGGGGDSGCRYHCG